jgi:hypothetical protein
MAKIISRFPNAYIFPLSWQIICEITPRFGKVKGKAIPLHAWKGPEGFRSLMFLVSAT